MQELANTLSAGKLIPYKCDLNNETEIEEMFSWLEKNHGGIDVLVNNAGVATNTPLLGKSSFKNVLLNYRLL